jgi:CBS domain-containing protein
MRELNVGVIPVCENDRMTGIITDRDIVIQAIAEGRDPHEVKVRDVMSSPVAYCFEDEELQTVARLMEEKQIRRIPVLSREKRLVGIISLGDLAAKTSDDALSAEVLERVSEPVRGQVA